LGKTGVAFTKKTHSKPKRGGNVVEKRNEKAERKKSGNGRKRRKESENQLKRKKVV